MSATSRPQVSVIIPAFRAAATLREAVESCLQQTFGSLEVLVIDDGSGDDTYDVAKACEASDPARVRVLQHPGGVNLGVAATRNLGLDAARGELMAFLDADDAWLPHKLQAQLGMLERNPDVGFVFSDVFNCVDPDPARPMSEQTLSRDPFREAMAARFNGEGRSAILAMNVDLESYRYIPSPTPLVRRALFDDGLRFFGPPRLNTQYEDFLMWRILSTRTRFQCDPEPLAIYRVHGSSFTVKFSNSRSALDHLLGLEEVQSLFMASCRPDLEGELVESMGRTNRQRVFGQAHRVPPAELPKYFRLAKCHGVLAAALQQRFRVSVVQARSALHRIRLALAGKGQGGG